MGTSGVLLPSIHTSFLRGNRCCLLAYGLLALYSFTHTHTHPCVLGGWVFFLINGICVRNCQISKAEKTHKKDCNLTIIPRPFFFLKALQSHLYSSHCKHIIGNGSQATLKKKVHQSINQSVSSPWDSGLPLPCPTLLLWLSHYKSELSTNRWKREESKGCLGSEVSGALGFRIALTGTLDRFASRRQRDGV